MGRPKSPNEGAGHVLRPPLEILFQDNHLLVINKPAGIATMGTTEAPSLHSLACDYLRQKYNKPGNVFVGIVSRLDTVTSGVIVLARTSKAAARLSPQFADHSGKQAAKIYLAIIEDVLRDDEGELVHLVRKDDDAHRMRAVRVDASKGDSRDAKSADAKRASLRYVVLDRGPAGTMIAVRLLTGRKHQIRIQFSEIGHPLLGDRKYGAKCKFGPDQYGFPGVALHSWRLQISHPTLQQPLAFGAQPPRTWKQAAADLPVPTSLDAGLYDRLKLPPFVPLCD